MHLFLLFCHYSALNFDRKEKLDASSAWEHPSLLGLWDNESTWQHRAKNIWSAPKITEENEKRVGYASTHLSLQA